MLGNLRKRIEKLESGFDLLFKQMNRDSIRFVTYQQNGKKYLALTAFGDDGVQWSKHFIVEGIADDRGINTNAINNEALFKHINPL